MSDIMAAYRQLPLVSRSIATAVFVVSLGCSFGILPHAWFYFHPSLLLRIPPQIWRIPGCFLISGNILFDPYLVYQALSQLERGRFSRREDLVWYLTCVAIGTITIDQLLGFGHAYYLQGLIIALTYSYSQDQRGVSANFFFLTIPAQLVPYAIMLFSLLTGGPAAVLVQVCGLLAAHLFDVLTRIWPEFGGGANLLPTPAFLTRLVGESPAAAAPSAAGRGFGGSGPLPDSWRRRGGHRLGGD